jgi:eukaryotic-like serine/threonine-protein kinase
VSALDDATVRHLREVLRVPDLTGTRYRLGDEIGRGGMGTVYEVEDVVLGRRVALKVLDLPGLPVESRLTREARVLARLEHPGIVPVHDAGTLSDGRAYYAMKLVRGERLDRAVARGLPAPARFRMFLRVAEAVAFAHAQGVLHRDLKPENVMLGPFGEVLVLDWGIAKLLGAPATDDAPPPAGEVRAPDTGAGSVLGTPGYMPPEQASGAGAVDGRSDVYALGALLRFLVTSGGEARPPAAIRAIWARAMAETPEARYPDVPAMAADVERFLAGEPVSAHRETWLERVGRVARRHRVALLLVLAYLVMRAVLLFAARR